MTDDNNPEALIQTAHAVRRSTMGLARQLRRMRSARGLSGAKHGLLARIERLGRPITASDLASVERLQPQSMTRLIADLEERGLIRRTQNDGDRRQFLIVITPEGRELLAEDARRQNQWLSEKIAATLTPAEADLLAIAAKLIERLSLEQEHAPARREPGGEEIHLSH